MDQSDQSDLLKDLQTVALTSETDICDLLRKALYVATKLANEPMKQWIELELHGYPSNTVPPYRQLRSTSLCQDPGGRLVPFEVGDTELWEKLEIVPMNLPIAELVRLAAKTEGDILITYQMSTEQELMRLMEPIALKPVRRISLVQVAGIVDAVRTKVLNFAMEMDKGKPSVRLTSPEKVKEVQPTAAVVYAETVNQYSTGPISNSVVQQGGQANTGVVTSLTTNEKLLKEIDQALAHLAGLTNVDTKGRVEATARLEALKKLVESDSGSKKEKSALAAGAYTFLMSVSSGWAANQLPALSAMAAKFGWITTVVDYVKHFL